MYFAALLYYPGSFSLDLQLDLPLGGKYIVVSLSQLLTNVGVELYCGVNYLNDQRS